MRVLIKGEELTFLAVNKGGDRKTTFKLNPAKSPKQIDITSLDGQETGQTAACIYVLGKDQLTICMPFLIDPTLRPSEFKSTADNGLMVIVLVKLPAK
ncbi:MAG: hypothetical protein JWO38_4418 [Gemmataceae bacterium]|nr:hypothetical protein [Gemmataceae bacterium]